MSSSGASPSGATHLVRDALAGTGIELVASLPVAAYDAEAPRVLRSSALMPGARGIVVAASAGPALWRLFRARLHSSPALRDASEPFDTFVALLLDRADEALATAGIRCRRLEAAFHAIPRVDFLAFSRLSGLGAAGPFHIHIHEQHGPWWALRGAWLVDAVVDEPLVHRPPCRGCPAPCIAGTTPGSVLASPEVRARCVVGQASRYDDDQIAYHYDLDGARARQKSAI